MKPVTLISNDYNTIEEALYSFGIEFKQRYPGANLEFCPAPLKTAIREVIDAKDIDSRRPLVIYLHNEYSYASDTFITEVLCNTKIGDLLKEKFVLWGWDCTDENNDADVIDWLNEASMSDVTNKFVKYDVCEYPVLFVVYRCDGILTPTVVLNGLQHQDADYVYEVLTQSVTVYEKEKSIWMARETARREREQLCAQQKADYETAKEQDRLKMEERRRIAREAEEALLQAAENVKRHQILAASLPPEPLPSNENALTIRLRFPDSTYTVRRFLFNDSLQLLIDFAGSQGYLSDQYCIFSSDFPRINLATLNAKASFGELKWSRREQVIVAEI